MQASLGIAKESANAARNSVELAREEFIATYCPRLIIRRIKVYQANDVPLEIHYELANIGGTRAKVVEISARLWLPDIQKSYFPPVPPYAMAEKPLNIVVESGAPYQGRHKVDLTEDIEEYALRWSYTEGVMRDQHSSMDAYFLGYIVYLDQLDRRFETAFLREYNFFTKRFTPVDDPDYEYRA